MNSHIFKVILGSSVTQMFLGGLISILTTIFLDWKKRPKLRFDIATHTGGRPRVVDTDGKVIGYYEEVGLFVRNLKRRPLGWPRQTLQRAVADISFLNPNTGANLFGGPMHGRWASLPQPEVVEVNNGKRQFRGDQSIIKSIPMIDIPWGEGEKLDIAARFDGESLAYGWSNENYYDPASLYRSRWKIEMERCLVKVVIKGSGEKLVAVFALVNINGNPLRLEEPTRIERRAALE